MRWPKDILFSAPSTVDAARVGQPNLNPPNDAISATDVLKPDAKGPVFTAAAAPATASNADDSSGDAVPINAEPQSEVDDSPTTGVGAQIISTGSDPSDANSNTNGGTSTSSQPQAAPAAAPASKPDATPSVLAPVGSDTGNSTLENSATGTAGTAAAAPAAADPAPTSAAPAGSAAPASASTSQPAGKVKASKNDPKTESSSKKKHGLHKIVPF